MSIIRIILEVEIVYKDRTGDLDPDKLRKNAHMQMENEFAADRFNFTEGDTVPTVYLNSFVKKKEE